jgi:hypothetical protein
MMAKPLKRSLREEEEEEACRIAPSPSEPEFLLFAHVCSLRATLACEREEKLLFSQLGAPLEPQSPLVVRAENRFPFSHTGPTPARGKAAARLLSFLLRLR